tara:strand:+ start:650 stop:1612 length:963 start_codon:yes stop_codon:yes gene_type:complete
MKYLITGITGQDGLFLTSYLKGGENNIIGISRNKNNDTFFSSLKYLNNETDLNNIEIKNINLTIIEEVSNLISEYKPDYIFNFSGPSSVYESIENPIESKNQIENIFLNLVSSCSQNNFFPNFFQASSSQMFDISENKLNEKSKFLPQSPYAEAKLNVHLKVADLRKKYDWNINSGIMFNHESEFRGDDYLFMKIINIAIKIKENKENKLTVGSLDLIRDWSYAADFTEAIHSIATDPTGDDYVIGSGTGTTIKEVIQIIFGYFDLDWEKYINIDEKLLRKGDSKKIVSEPKKIYEKFNWKTETSVEKLIEKCIKFKLKN